MPTNSQYLETLCQIITGNLNIVARLSSDDLFQIAELAIQHGLASVLLWRLNQSKDFPTDVLSHPGIVEVVRENALRSMLLQKTFRELVNAFADLEGPIIWIKGAALSRTIYPKPELRPMVDLDVLVPYTQRYEALELARHLEFDFLQNDSLLYEFGEELMLTASHHFVLQSRRSVGSVVEIHYGLLGDNPTSAHLLSEEHLAWFFTQAEPVQFEGMTFLSLKPEAHLLFLCAHAMLQHGEIDFYAQRQFDLHLLISNAGLDWELITHMAEKIGWADAVNKMLFKTKELFGTTDIPDASVKQLAAARTPPHIIKHSEMLSGADVRWARFENYLRQLPLDMKMRFVTRAVFPGSEFMRRTYGGPQTKVIWPYYFVRWISLFKAVVSMLKDRMRYWLKLMSGKG